MTDAKNKLRLSEKNSNRRTFRGQKARHQELKKDCDYVDDKRKYGYAVTSEMCQGTRHHGFQSYTASL